MLCAIRSIISIIAGANVLIITMKHNTDDVNTSAVNFVDNVRQEEQQDSTIIILLSL